MNKEDCILIEPGLFWTIGVIMWNERMSRNGLQLLKRAKDNWLWADNNI